MRYGALPITQRAGPIRRTASSTDLKTRSGPSAAISPVRLACAWARASASRAIATSMERDRSCGNGLLQDLRARIIDVDHAAGLDHQQLHRCRRRRERSHDPVADVLGIREGKRRSRSKDEDTRHVLPLLVLARRPPYGASRHARQLRAIGSGNGVEAVNEGQHDREQHARFDRQRHDQRAARRHEQDLPPAPAADADHLVRDERS